MIKIMTVDFNFNDDRGSITQLIHKGYKQVNVITSKANVFRGGHYHKQNEEAFYIVSGKVKVTVNGEEYIFSDGDFFGIEANDTHEFNFIEDTILVSMYSNGVELPDGTKDIFTE